MEGEGENCNTTETEEANLKLLIVDRVESLLLDGCLSLRVLALVREEVGLDVGVREAVTVGSCQSSCSVHMDHQNPVLVVHGHQYLPRDVVVSLPTCLTGNTHRAAKATRGSSWGLLKVSFLYD